MSERILNFCNISGDSVKKYEGIKRYIATGDIIDNKIISYTEVDYNNKPSRANQNAQIGDVVFAKMKDTKKVISINEENANYIYSTGFYIIRPKENVLTDYLYWLFNSPKFNRDKDKYCKGATQKALNNDGLKKIEIQELPNIEEQKSIICKLNKISEVIERKKEQLVIFDELIKSQFVEMFGELSNSKYPTVKLSSIADVGSSHRVFTTEFVENGIPFYRGTEIGLLANQEKPKDCYYISEEHYFKICDDSTRPKIGDLLLPSICNKGQIWMVDTTEPFYYKDGRVLSISPKEGKINHKYFHQFMKYKTVKEYSKLGSGSTFAEFKIFILKDFDVILPPIELQNQFADIVKQIDKQKFEIENSLKEMQKLYESLMEKYFG